MTLCECGCGNPAPISKRDRRERGQVKGQPVRFIRGHAMRGKTLSDESRAKMSAVRTGRRHSLRSRLKLMAAVKRGPNNPAWKGDDVTYRVIHRWINRVATKTGTCSRCGEERLTQWANLSGNYRRDVNDFAEMCVPCHSRYDRLRRLAA